MATEKSKATQFKKGQVANPLGGRAHNPETRALRGLTREQLADVLRLLLENNVDELQALADERATPIMKAAAAKAALRAYYSGDWSFLEGPLMRTLGAVKVEVEATGKNGSPLIPATAELRAAELETILKTLGALSGKAPEQG